MAAHFAEACRRLTAVALVHQRLRRSEQVRSVDFGPYLEELRDGLVEGWGAAWDQQIRVRAAAVALPTKAAVILALVVTELVTNAVRHAYGGKPGPVEVTAVREEARPAVRIAVEDHGSRPGGERSDGGFGSRLIRALLTQLGGKIVLEDNRPGLRAVLEVPLPTGPEPP